MANYPGDYTPNFALVKPIVGADSGAWGTLLNSGVMAIVDAALGSATPVSITSADVTLSTTQFQNMAFVASGTLTGNRSLKLPLNNITSPTNAVGGKFIVQNNCTGSFTLTVKTAVSTSAGVTVPYGRTAHLWSDGVDVRYANNGMVASVQAVSGSPNGQLAGTAGSVNTNADIAADYVAGKVYLCTQSGTALSASWTDLSGFPTFLPQNMALTASVSANVLTVSVLAANTGTTPASGSPVIIPFGDSTVTAGDPVSLTITSALTATTSVGATLGVSAASTPFRYWIGVFNGTGTPYIGLTNCLASGVLYPIDDSALRSTVAMSGGATNPGTFYTNGVSLTSKAFRLLGYLEYSAGLATNGTFNTPPTLLRLFTAGTKKPGDVVQKIVNVTTALVSATTPTTIAFSDALPNSGGGFAIINASTTPVSAMNLWELDAGTCVNLSNAQTGPVMFIVQDTAAATTAIAAVMYAPFVGSFEAVSLSYQTQVSTTSLTTFTLRTGGDSASNWFINGSSAGRRYGGSLQTSLRIVERMA